MPKSIQWRKISNFLHQGSPILQILGKLRFKDPQDKIVELILFLEANKWRSLVPRLACSFFRERAWVQGYQWPRLICSFHPHLDTLTGFHPSHSCVCNIVSFPGVEEGEEKECLVHTVCTRQWTLLLHMTQWFHPMTKMSHSIIVQLASFLGLGSEGIHYLVLTPPVLTSCTEILSHRK